MSACDGAAPAGDGGSEAVDAPAAITIGLATSTFFDMSAVPDATLWFFDDGIVREACAVGCQEVTTDASGTATVRALPGAPFAYHVMEGTYTDPSGATETFVETLRVGARAPSSDGATEAAPIASASAVQTVYTLYMRAQAPDLATIVGRVVDDLGAPAAGRTVRVLAEGTELPLSTCTSCDGVTVRYSWSGSFAVTATESEGFFIVLGVPVDAHVTIESVSSGATERCQEVAVLAGAVTFAEVTARTCGT